MIIESPEFGALMMISSRCCGMPVHRREPSRGDDNVECHHEPTFGQVVLIQFTVADGSLCPLPGFAQPGGAVIEATGTVMIRSGSHTENGYWGTFLLNPTLTSLYAR